MEGTGEGDAAHDTIDANIQNSEFANELYGKLEQEISFEDALKNNNSSADQEIPYLDIQFDKDAAASQQDNFELNGDANNHVGGEEKMEEAVEAAAAGETAELIHTENEVLVDEILGEQNQNLDESIGPEVEERLLADSEEEEATAGTEAPKKQTEETGMKEESFESSEIKDQEDVADSLREEPQLVEEIIVEEGEASQDEAEKLEDVPCVVEEPSGESNAPSTSQEQAHKDVEIQEAETIMIEEISTDGSVGSTGNPPVVAVPEEPEKEKVINTEEEVIEGLEPMIVEQENETEGDKVTEGTVIVEDESEVEKVGEHVIVEGESEVDNAGVIINDESTEVKPQSETEEVTVLKMEEIEDQNKSTIVKDIEEAPIIIDEMQPELEKQIEENQIVLEQDNESMEESIIIIEETEIMAGHVQEADASKESEPQPQKQEEDKTKPKKSVLEKIKIPHHVLGTNIEKPVRDLCSNGRVPPKPRLGVKIPYRNLTSQIVSKQEIEQVILDRARAKQQQPPPGGDLFFTKKLTQRLARKILPEEKKRAAEEEEKKKKESASAKPAQDADLLAILEGDADDIVDVPAGGDKAKGEAVEVKEWEREMALKQLEQMPPRRRGRSAGLDQPAMKKPTTSTPVKPTADPPKSVKPSAIPVPQKAPTEEKPKENTQKSDNLTEDDIEPRFSTNSVVKTYTRKRKPTESVSSLAKVVDADTSPKKPLKTVNEQKEQKVSIDLPPNAYVTKSSRVIKRKVIWDPDEAASPIRSYKAPKTEATQKPEKASSPPKTLEKKPAKTPQKAPEEKAKQKSSEDKQKVAAEKPTQKKVDKAAALLKKPKRLTEVDRLLMDEGAVNMLYDVKTTEDQNQTKQKKRNVSTISLDRAQRELLNKTNEIKNDLQIYSTRESPKSLRKKDGASVTPPQLVKKETAQPGAISRKKSRDSNRSSVHSPPASPAYVFPQHAEASRIIRRHSSSSFSSGDEEAALKESDKEEAVKVAKKKGGEQKSTKRSKETLSAADRSRLNEEMSKSFNELTEKSGTKAEKYGEFKTLSVKTEDKMVHVSMNVGRKEALLNVPVLNELTVVFNQIKNDKACNAVLLTSSHKSSFCQGLDYKQLLADTEEQRKKKATTLANAVKEFLQTLAAFPKFVAAAVEGNSVGLGVTMLPLFDMVLSSDKATFSAPYCHLGCAAEGGALLNLPHVASCSLASELLYASQKMMAAEAAKLGLVTRIVWADNFQEDVLNTVRAVSNQSQQALEAVKQQLRRPLLESIQASIERDVETLVQQWVSAECQQNFGRYRPDRE